MSVAFDTMVLIWGGLQRNNPKRGTVTPWVTEMRRRSRLLIRELEERKERIIIPTVAVAELLVGVASSDHGNFVAVLTERFFCPPLDLRAAALAAELWQYHRDLPAEQQIERKVLKSDVLIVATAKVAGATSFYSHDDKCRKLAERAGLKARDLPTHSENLFINAEIDSESQAPPPGRS